MFPWLFPYGCGGIGSSGWSDERHVKYLMMYYDKRFQQDPTFSFVAFSHSQIKSTSQGTYLLADKNKFTAVADRLLNADQDVMEDMARRMADSEHV